jgi:hypothetical protein
VVPVTAQVPEEIFQISLVMFLVIFLAAVVQADQVRVPVVVRI